MFGQKVCTDLRRIEPDPGDFNKQNANEQEAEARSEAMRANRLPVVDGRT